MSHSSLSTVPVVQLKIIHDDGVLKSMTKESQKMVNIVSSTFETRFQSKPNYLVKVPGRVNLIGDHIDYCGFPVLPMALDQGMWFAVGYEFRNVRLSSEHLGTTKLTAHNVNSSKYHDFDVYLDDAIEVDSTGHPTWRDYFLSGIKGTMNQLSPTVKERLTMVTKINVVVHGNVIPSSGLSSSSALVSGSVTVFNFLLDGLASDDGDRGVRMNKTRLAQLSANSERLIGTESGGMDQAIAFLAERSTAKYIEFEPNLRGTSINIPKDVTFFISHSNVVCNKGSDDQYNSRVLDTRIGAALIYHHLLKTNFLPDNLIRSSQELRNKKGFLQLSDVLRLYVQAMNQSGNENVSDTDQSVFMDMISLIYLITDQFKDSYSIGDVLNQLDINNIDELLTLISGKSLGSWPRFKALINNRTNNFKIRSRVEHVFYESSLVEKFREICSDHHSDTVNSDLVNSEVVDKKLGDILNASQKSMKEKCESSVEQVDQLCELSLNCGSLGVRISGAGFGGCVVALVPINKREEYQFKLKQQRPEDEFTFESLPSAGVTIFNILQG